MVETTEYSASRDLVQLIRMWKGLEFIVDGY